MPDFEVFADNCKITYWLSSTYIKFEVQMKINVFRDVVLCTLLEANVLEEPTATIIRIDE
jgi:hypothetical protein